jgi:hypothetical protein
MSAKAKMIRCFGAMTIALLAIGTMADSARAEECGQQKQPVRSHVQRINGKKTTVIETECSITTSTPKPKVLMISAAKKIDYVWDALDHDATPQILRSIQQVPRS